ncbi:MAG: MarR family transcriptional regulator [Candidatus Dormibacteria bacterium]
MAVSETEDPLLGMLRHTIIGLVRRDGPDLTARQLAIFLICYLESEVQTVRGLAAKLGISKPAVSRALDRLGEFSFVRREDDPLDRRSILIRRTRKGLSLLRELGRIMEKAPMKAHHTEPMRMASSRALSARS